MDLIERQAAIDAVEVLHGGCITKDVKNFVRYQLLSVPSAQPEMDEWCTDCKEYDQERHCCPRFGRVIRDTLDEVAPRWIPVTKRLPKLDEDVLLCYIEYDRWHGQYVSVGQGKRFTFEWIEDGEDENEVEWEWVFANELVHLVEVKYWMPLPEPPKGEDND